VAEEPWAGNDAESWRRAALALLLVAGVSGSAIALAPEVPPPPDDAAPSATLAPADASTATPTDAGPAAPPSAPAAPPPPPYVELDGGTLPERNAALLVNMQHALGLTEAQVSELRAVFAASEYIGQGNPAPTRHPLTRAECLERRAKASQLAPADLRCGAPNMVPVYDREAGETASQAKVCVDQFEFPNVECEYPVVWVRANEAQALCQALGKRLCDAHEWEGGCAGSLKPPASEYAFGERRLMMQYLHNKSRKLTWAYGPEKNHALCATGSQKSPKCPVPSFRWCGSNDYPAGSFPECVSSFGVYDLHGNVAEHMSFPLTEAQLGSRGGSGETEMKGSWFIFQALEAHEDDCRFRAPDWHVTRVTDPNSHRNYHLGFRCCKDLD
jgi:formylglycine-generating enzyme